MQNNNFLNKLGWPLLIIFAASPVVILFFDDASGLRFSRFSDSSASAGKIAGILGFALFCLAIILSSRAKVLEKFFGGMNFAYFAKHLLGGISFILLLFHPLLMALRYLTFSYGSTALFLLPSGDWARNFGQIALFIMMFALITTFYFGFKYQIWKFTHKFLGLAFVFAVFHVFVIQSDVGSNNVLRIYFFGLVSFAIIAFFYRALFNAYLVKKFDYTVKNIREFKDEIWEIEMEPDKEKIRHSAGQFIFINFISNELSNEIHPFSISSAPGQAFKIAVKKLGDWTNKISGLKPGDKAKIEGPFGYFNFRNFKNKNQIWIAGGVGITPFLGMLRDLTNKDFNFKITLYYSVKDENCFAFKEEIIKILENNKNLNIIFWNSKASGFLTAEAIKNQIPNILDFDILICGPGPMMSGLKSQFIKIGNKKNKIHTEEFKLKD
jgi:predicted ferric reductase